MPVDKEINKCLIFSCYVGLWTNIKISTCKIKLQYILWLQMYRNLLEAPCNLTWLITSYCCMLLYCLSLSVHRDAILSRGPLKDYLSWWPTSLSKALFQVRGWCPPFLTERYRSHYAPGRCIQLLSKTAKGRYSWNIHYITKQFLGFSPFAECTECLCFYINCILYYFQVKLR